MRKLRWRKSALGDLESIHAWLSTIEHADADRAMLRIRNAAESLIHLGDIGRPSRVQGLRELSVRVAPYVVVYQMAEDEIEIVAVYHTAQDR